MADHPIPAPAKTLTPDEHRQRVDKAFKLERKIKVGVARVSEATWALAEALYEFDQLRGWELLGAEKIGDWLGQPDLGIGTSTYYWMVRLWRDLVEVQKVSPRDFSGLNPSKVREVLPAIMRGKVSVEQALNDAEALSRSDLRERYSQATIDAPLAAEEEPVKVGCPTCGRASSVLRVGVTLRIPRKFLAPLVDKLRSGAALSEREIEELAVYLGTEDIDGTARRQG